MENCLELEFKMRGLIYSSRTDQVKLHAQLVGTYKNRSAKPECASSRETAGNTAFCSLLPKQEL